MSHETNDSDEDQKLPEKLEKVLDSVLEMILSSANKDQSAEVYDRLMRGDAYNDVLEWYSQEACPVPVTNPKIKKFLREVVEATLQHVLTSQPQPFFLCPCGCKKKVGVVDSIRNLRLSPFLKFFQLCN